MGGYRRKLIFDPS